MVRSQTGSQSPTIGLLRYAAKFLMQRWEPEREMPAGVVPVDDDDADTGGYTPIMFTTTNRQPLQSGATQEAKDLDKLNGTPGMLRSLKVGTPHFHKPGDTTPAGNIKSSLIIYSLVASYTDSAGKKWFLINGGSDTNMNWVRDADVD